MSEEFPTHEQDIIALYLAVAPPLLRTHFRDDCCIAATKIGIEALRYFGVESRPLSVGARIFNAKAVEVIEKIGHIVEDTDPKAKEYVQEGYWSIWIGKTGRKTAAGRWDGHLVVATDNYLVDATLDRYARPEKDLPLRSASFERPANWDGSVGYELPGGVKILYIAYGTDRSYQHYHDWIDRHKDITGIVIKQMKERR